jgi:hypothetical protein
MFFKDDENIPCVTKLPDFYDWIDGEKVATKNEHLRQRLFSDGYLYFYQHIPTYNLHLLRNY